MTIPVDDTRALGRLVFLTASSHEKWTGGCAITYHQQRKETPFLLTERKDHWIPSLYLQTDYF